MLRSLGRGLLAGSLSGVLVLGVGGRLVMSVIAWRAGLRVGYTAGGTAEVVLMGAFLGLAGGFLYGALLGPSRRAPRGSGSALALVYFVGLVLVPPPAARSAASGLADHRVIVVLLFGSLFLLYGFVLEVAENRIATVQRRRRSMERQERSDG